MTALAAEDLFQVLKNAQDSGLLDLWPGLQAKMGPGEKFFESLQKKILEEYDIDKLDVFLYNMAPTIRYMSDPVRWEPMDFSSEELFQAVKNLQLMGAFDIKKDTAFVLPGGGDRFFEYYQKALLDQVGIDNLDRMLFQLGQAIRFLATDAALENRRAHHAEH